MCDCLDTVLETSTKKLQENHPDDIIDNVSYVNEVFVLGNSIGTEVSIPIEYTIRRKKKDGTYAREVKKNIGLFGAYCPFCGKKKPKNGKGK